MFVPKPNHEWGRNDCPLGHTGSRKHIVMKALKSRSFCKCLFQRKRNAPSGEDEKTGRQTKMNSRPILYYHIIEFLIIVSL